MACRCAGLVVSLTVGLHAHTHLVLLSMFLFLRLTEQVRLKTDLERIMGALRERYRETQQWQKRHKVSVCVGGGGGGGTVTDIMRGEGWVSGVGGRGMVRTTYIVRAVHTAGTSALMD